MTMLFNDEPAPPIEAPAKKHASTMIAMMAGMGLRPELLGVLARFAQIPMTADEERWLTGPIVVHQNGWTETLPKWMPQQIRWERAEILFGLADKRLIVGPTEICAVMYPAMMAHPPGREFADLYCWAGVKASAKEFHKAEADLWKNMDCKPITDDEVLDYDGRYNLSHHYRELSHEIRRKVANHSRVADRITYHADRDKHEDMKKPVKAKPEVERTLFDCLEAPAVRP